MTGVGGDPSAAVPTYRGSVDAADLGWTLTHEHLFVLFPELDREHPHPEWDPDAAVASAVRGLEELFDLGVRTVVDLTVPGLGRSAELVGRVARRVRVNIVAATGWYTDDVLPPYFRTHGPGRLVGGPDPLVEILRRDVVDGIGETGVRAGVLKAVTDAPGLTPDVVRVMEAAATVHHETGVPVTTHSNPALRNGLDQARFFLERGVPASHLVIGHSGDSTDLDYVLELVDTGATLGMDRFGMSHTGDDTTRIAMVAELVRRGYASQLVLSHDSAYFSRITPPSWRRTNAPHWTPDHLSRRVVPTLRDQGVDDAAIETMMIANPRRLLTAAPVGAVR
ncbi:phosphotriesterase family protein [Solicola gregarius]|uniref:Phosphotriesterase-related protein n=1 Tax=Solicola gregarius TaxID=2908642 RepID=A0AA46TKL4_9ACTN|nr:hypothetical protein [Solicola gregarius]UYM06617.1 hypothetical protein L0C25_05975 [Solicola gregarius]